MTSSSTVEIGYGSQVDLTTGQWSPGMYDYYDFRFVIDSSESAFSILWTLNYAVWILIPFLSLDIS